MLNDAVGFKIVHRHPQGRNCSNRRD
eukprot:COSAG02_NODE_26778_length_625_cov_0.513308_1_plen_25_part_10